VCRKLIERHPHVFGEVTVSGSDEVLQNWDDIKRKSKSQPTQTDAINAIPKTFPALMKAQKVQGKAAKAGFDWRDPDGAFDKIAEESAELKRALAADGNVEEELGDLLFSCVNVARFCHVKAETALEKATAKFSRRFAVTEQLAAERGVDMKTAGLDVLDELWDEAKRQTD
ncbi:MAG: MazG family protein, partial [Clostridia bacterium]|nr:MazG family protein [Clostridia bacterium]